MIKSSSQKTLNLININAFSRHSRTKHKQEHKRDKA